MSATANGTYVPQTNIQDIPVDEIFSDPNFNCRGKIVPFDVLDLKESIARNGLQQPVVVQPYTHPKYKYRLVMGHRRHCACGLLGMKTIPAIINPSLTENEAYTLNLIENLDRKDLTIMQEAKAIERYFVGGMGITQVAKTVGRSQGWVKVRLTALKLPPEIQAEINAGFIKQEHITDLYSLGDTEQMIQWVRVIKDRRFRGDKTKIQIKPVRRPLADKPFERKVRSETEILYMQGLILDSIGSNLATRFAAWSVGAINNHDIFKDIEEAAKAAGKVFMRPA